MNDQWDQSTRVLPRIAFFAILLLGATAVARAQSPSGESKAPAGSISGRVTINGKGAPGIIVSAHPASHNARDRVLTRATTDEDGRYLLKGVEAGRYLVTTLSLAFIAPIENEFGEPGKSITLTEGEAVQGVDLTLAPGGIITGRVVDARGRPVIATHVHLNRLDDRGRQSLVSTLSTLMMQTDDRGIYRIYGLATGRYLVSVRRDGNDSQSVIYHPGVTDYTKATKVEVTAGNETAGVDIKLSPRTKTFSASGQMLEAETGHPVQASYRLELDTPGLDGQSTEHASSRLARNTDASGRFQIKDLSPGRYRLDVSSGRGASENLYSEPFYFEVTDRDLTGLEVKFYRGGSISGVMVAEGADEEEARWLPDPLVMVTTPGAGAPFAGHTFLYTDRSFRLNGLRPGRATISLRASVSDKFSLARIERDGIEIHNVVEAGAGGQMIGGIEIKPGEHITGVRVIVVYGTGIVRGRVEIEGGQLPAGLRLYVQCRRLNRRSGFYAQAETDALGRFELKNLSAGDYELQLDSPNLTASDPISRAQLQAVRQVVSVRDGAESTVTLTLHLGAQSKENEP